MPKVLTPEQLQSRKEQAVRFTRDVLGDPERAEEIGQIRFYPLSQPWFSRRNASAGMAGPLRLGNRATHSWKARARSSGDRVSRRG